MIKRLVSQKCCYADRLVVVVLVVVVVVAAAAAVVVVVGRSRACAGLRTIACMLVYRQEHGLPAWAETTLAHEVLHA